MEFRLPNARADLVRPGWIFETRQRVTGFFWCLLAIALALTTGASSAVAQVPDLPGWNLVWQDEFDAPEVDTTNWNVLTRENSFNNERQYYLPEQATIVDGKLRITATNELIARKRYRSARLESKPEFSQGRFEARIDLPTGKGMWPAFWLRTTTVPWPTGGEIDILENKGHEPNVVSSAYHWQSIPGPCCAHHRFVSRRYDPGSVGGTPVDFHDGFHVYAAEWEENIIRFYVDDVLHFVVRGDATRPIFETPKSIVLNLAVGGNFSGNPDRTTVFPQIMDIDYVRVWSRQIPEPSSAVLLFSAILMALSRRATKSGKGLC